MIRILVVDDLNDPGFIDQMNRTIRSSFPNIEVEAVHLNPVDTIGVNQSDSLQVFLELVRVSGEEFWDVMIIDLNLAEVPLADEEKLRLPIMTAEEFRKTNGSATVILYSGTLKDYVAKFLNGAVSAEAALKRVFRADILAFVPRSSVENEIISALDNPSWLLRIDRLLMTHAGLSVGPEESEFKGRSFADLAKAVRCQSKDGQKVAQLAAELGVAYFVDLNS